jgi:hypothetical protein
VGKILEVAVGSLMVRTRSTPLKHVWRLFYDVVVRLVSSYLRRGTQSARAYIRCSYATDDEIYGLSDVDLVITLPEDSPVDAATLRSRFERLCRIMPPLRRLVQVYVYREEELERLESSSLRTFGLDVPGDASFADRAAYFVSPRFEDDAGFRVRPGLYGPRLQWRQLAGETRSRPAGERRRHEDRMATWLELQRVWHSAFGTTANPNGRMTSYLSAKFVAESARIWLWVKHREVFPRRSAALKRLLEFMPQEEAAQRCLDVLEAPRLKSSAESGDEVLAFLERVSSSIAYELQTELAEAGQTTVRLIGNQGSNGESRTDSGGGRKLPLADWRSVAIPTALCEELHLAEATEVDADVVTELMNVRKEGAQPALWVGDLLILPAVRYADTMMRAVQFVASDPVSFALLEGRTSATFPDLSGWSALDWARRAVIEHGSWLEGCRAQGTIPTKLSALQKGLTAARAGLFWESVTEGEPCLPLTIEAIIEGPYPDKLRLAVSDVFEEHQARSSTGGPPSISAITRLCSLLEELPAFRMPTRGIPDSIPEWSDRRREPAALAHSPYS